MGIRGTSSIRILRREAPIAIPIPVAKSSEITEPPGVDYPPLIGRNSPMGDTAEGQWKDYLYGARLKDEHYVLRRSSSDCAEFAAGLMNFINRQPHAGKSIGRSNLNHPYEYVSIQRQRVKVGSRVFGLSIWQNFDAVDSETFLGSSPTGAVQLSIFDSKGRLYARSAMKSTGGRDRWEIAPEPLFLRTEGPRKVFNCLNAILNRLASAENPS
jgi:hypothetical protein